MLRFPIDAVKDDETFEKMISNSMIERGCSRMKTRKISKRFIAALALVIVIAAVGCSFLYVSDLQKGSSGKGTQIPNGVCSMFLHDGKLYFTDFKDGLYKFDSLTGKSEKISQIDINPGTQAFQYDGYIYFSSGSAIYQRSLKDGTSRKLLSGEYLGVDAVEDGRLYYGISYKDPKAGGFTEFEYHIYDLSSGKDTVLFKRSNDTWFIRDIEGNTIVTDTYMQSIVNGKFVEDDYGIFIVDPVTGSYKKISAMRPMNGCIANGKFYFTPAINEKGLWAADLDGSKTVQVKLPGADEPDYMVISVINYDDFLYAGVYSDGKNHVVSLSLKTGETKTIADTSGRVGKFCTDRKTLYAYDAEFPYDRGGNITVIPLE